MVRRYVFALFIMTLLALGSAGFMPMQVQASQVEGLARGYIRDFYNDGSYSQVIGSKILNCDASVSTYGSRSDYYITEYFDC